MELTQPLSREDIDSIWEAARLIAKDQLGESALSGMDGGFPSTNPYEIGSLKHEEHEAAHEHYIMTGLGY